LADDIKKKNILLTQAVITDTAKSIFEILKKKGGGDGTSQYSTLLSLRGGRDPQQKTSSEK
jgi:hypothetical protein